MAGAGLVGFLTKRLEDRIILDWVWDGFGRMIDGRMIFWVGLVGRSEMNGRRGTWGIFDKTIGGQNHF
jgi:hypothetical protein